MDNKQTFRPKRPFNNKTDRFTPICAIGKLLFFDYNKNKFGFISDVKCEKNIQLDKVHVSESGLATDKKLYDGEIATLILNKGHKGYFATNVKSFNEIDLTTITDYIELIGINELEKAIHNSVRYDYQNLSSENKELVYKVIQNISSVEAWSLLLKIGADDLQIENYITNIIGALKDEEKLNFLKKSFSLQLLKNILSNLTTHEKGTLLNLFEIIRSKEIPVDLISDNLISLVCEIEWSFEEIYKIFSMFRVPKIAQYAINKFSFKVYNYEDKLRTLLQSETLNNENVKILKENLISEKETITASTIINIYSELKEYRVIKDENELLVLLSDKKMKVDEIEELISFLSRKCETELFRQVINKNIDNISSWKIIEVIESCQQKVELCKVIIDEYYSRDDEDLDIDYSRIINYIKEQNNKDLAFHFVENFYLSLSSKYSVSILELSILSKHVNAQKFAYQNIKFKSESEIIEFINTASNLKITNEVSSSNKPLTAFLNFLNSDSGINLTEDCKQFLKINNGIVQCLSVKFLIYQLYKQKINKTKLLEILNSFQWTEISALLIKSFILESNYAEKILLDKLNQIFKTHFEVLSSQNFDPKSFLDNFTIRNILNTCNGRKYYNAELWQKNGVSRWYVKGGVSTYTKESMNCYCEGRPWKKESIWDSQTNKPSSEKYEFYWCKTSYCAARNDSITLNKVYYDWTLSEIAEALNINIEKIALATLAGWANRMNQIVEHLFCRTCKEVLRPLPYKPTTLGYYAVPLFHCINDKCPDKQTIRFTHCLNGKCESHRKSEPLDSRDCESCRPNDPNHTGLQCNFCGSSCPACSGYNNRIIANEMW